MAVIPDVYKKKIKDSPVAETKTPRMIITRYGDGYVERRAAGLANLEQEYTLEFTSLTQPERTALMAFFEGLSRTGESLQFSPDPTESDRNWLIQRIGYKRLIRNDAYWWGIEVELMLLPSGI